MTYTDHRLAVEIAGVRVSVFSNGGTPYVHLLAALVELSPAEAMVVGAALTAAAEEAIRLCHREDSR